MIHENTVSVTIAVMTVNQISRFDFYGQHNLYFSDGKFKIFYNMIAIILVSRSKRFRTTSTYKSKIIEEVPETASELQHFCYSFAKGCKDLTFVRNGDKRMLKG